MVCVTQQKSCERLIHAAAELLADDGELYVIHVTRENWNFVDNARDGEAMEYLFSVSKSYGADLTILRSDRVSETIAQFAQAYKVSLLVMGEAPVGSSNELFNKMSALLEDSSILIRALPNGKVLAS